MGKQARMAESETAPRRPPQLWKKSDQKIDLAEAVKRTDKAIKRQTGTPPRPTKQRHGT
jgi:hypothetical protein